MENITIKASINAPVEKVWSYYTLPEHVTKWNNASEDWHSPRAENDLREGGRFNFRMESITQEEGFDFTGEYTKVEKHAEICYTMDDGRKVSVSFNNSEDKTEITITFEAETQNSLEMQKQGWQAILNNFKDYVENN